MRGSLFFAVLFLSFLFISGKAPDEKASGPLLVFDTTRYDFGTVKEGDAVKYDFPFTNKGDQPLVITSTVSACGCDVASCTREPILPGERNVVHYLLDTRSVRGTQHKLVTVQSNSAGANPVILIITGRVEQQPAAASSPSEK